jgi:hypothetical protein
MEMVIWNCSNSTWRWCFGTAASGEGDGVLELQQEQMEIYVGNTARTDGDGMLVIPQEQMEMIFWNCSKSG